MSEKFLVEIFLHCDPLVGEPAIYEVYHHPDDNNTSCTCGVFECDHVAATIRRVRRNGGIPVARKREQALRTAPITLAQP